MSSYLNDIRPRLIALSGLEAQILTDLDTTNGGVSWWGHLDPARRILIGDYVLSLITSIEDNLAEAAMHRSKVTALWSRESAWFRGRVVRQQMGDSDWLSPDTETQDRRVEIDAHLGGFFRAIGSIMDNVAGLVIGVAGLKTKIVKADVSDLRLDKNAPKGALPEGDLGRVAQVDFTALIRRSVEAGPDGWWPWVNSMRNTLVHRARRLSFQLPDQRRASGFMRPLPQNPDQTDAESLARANRYPGNFLREDAADTLSGAMTTTLEVVRAAAGGGVDIWRQRRDAPDLIRQPIEQWPDLDERTLGFRGWAPGNLPHLTTTTFLMVSPGRGRRLQAAMLMDGSRDQWRRWWRADGRSGPQNSVQGK